MARGDHPVRHSLETVQEDIEGVGVEQEGATLHNSIRELYITRAKEEDKESVKRWTADMESLLLFSALFSAVVTAFLVTTYPELQEDETLVGVQLLQQILCNVEQKTDCPVLTRARPTSSTIQLNIYWFTSLILSLSASFLAILVKQWISHFEAGYAPDPVMRSRQRAFRILGMTTWHMHSLISSIPVILHIALIFFFVGLLEFLRHLERTLANVATVLVATTLFFYVATILLPIVRIDCPFKTPLTSLLYGAMIKTNLALLFIVSATISVIVRFSRLVIWAILKAICTPIPWLLPRRLRQSANRVFEDLLEIPGAVEAAFSYRVKKLIGKLFVRLRSFSYKLSGTTRENEAIRQASERLDAVVLSQLLARREEADKMVLLVEQMCELRARYDALAKHRQFFTDSDGVLPLSGLNVIVSLTEHLTSLLTTHGITQPFENRSRHKQLNQCLDVLAVLTTEMVNTLGHTSFKTTLGFIPENRIASRSKAMLYPIDSVGVDDYIPALASAIQHWPHDALDILCREDDLAIVANILRIQAKVVFHRRAQRSSPAIRALRENLDILLSRLFHANRFQTLPEPELVTIAKSLVYILLRGQERVGFCEPVLPVLTLLACASRRTDMSFNAHRQVLWGICALLDPPKMPDASVLIPQLRRSLSFLSRIGEHMARAAELAADPLQDYYAHVELLSMGGILATPREQWSPKEAKDRGRILKVFFPKFVDYLEAYGTGIGNFAAVARDLVQAGRLAEILRILEYIAFKANNYELSHVDLVELVSTALAFLRDISLHMEEIPSSMRRSPSHILHMACRFTLILVDPDIMENEEEPNFSKDLKHFLGNAVQTLVVPVQQVMLQVLKLAQRAVDWRPTGRTDKIMFKTAATEAIMLTSDVMANVLRPATRPPILDDDDIDGYPPDTSSMGTHYQDHSSRTAESAYDDKEGATPSAYEMLMTVYNLVAETRSRLSDCPMGDPNTAVWASPEELMCQVLKPYAAFLADLSVRSGNCVASAFIKPLEIARRILFLYDGAHKELQADIDLLAENFNTIIEDTLERSLSSQTAVQFYGLVCEMGATCLHGVLSPPGLDDLSGSGGQMSDEETLRMLQKIISGLMSQPSESLHPGVGEDYKDSALRALAAILDHLFTNRGVGADTFDDAAANMRKSIRAQVKRLQESADSRVYAWASEISIGEELGSDIIV